MLQKESTYPCFLNRAIAFFAGVLLLPFIFNQTAFGQQQQRHLLGVINAYHESAPWLRDIFMTVTAHLSTRNDLQIDPVYMNATLITDQEYFDRTVDGVFRHFDGQKPDYLLLLGGMTITLRDRILEEWGDIPFIFVSKTDIFGPPSYYFTSDTSLCPPEMLSPIENLRDKYNFTFVQYPDLYAPTTDMLVRMRPQTKKIVMLSDASYHNRHIAIETQKYIAGKYPAINYEWLISKDENDARMQKLLTTENPEVSMLLCSWFYGRTGVLGNREILSGGINLIPAVKQPIFTLRESYIQDNGAIGGVFADYGQVCSAIMSALDKMLEGVPVRDIPFVVKKDLRSHPIIDYSILQNAGIPQSLCPENTIYINKPPTLLQKYKWQFLLGGMVLLLTIIIVTFRIVLQQKRLHILKRFNTLLSNMPIGYTRGKILFSTDGKITDLEYHSSNTAFQRLLAENSIPGEPDKLFPKPYIAAQTVKLLQENLPCLFTHHFKRTDSYFSFVLCLTEQGAGSRKKNESDINVDLFAIDVTERSKAEKDLRTLSSKMELTLQLARIIPWYWNLNKREITCDAHSFLRNPRNKRLYKNKGNATITINEDDFFEHIHPEDKAKVHAFYTDLIQCRTQYVKTEFRIQVDRGNKTKTEWFEINAIITEKDKEGKPLSLSGSLLIITKRKQQELALIAAREQARESDRMKSAFLANMSHEIRTPLNAIVGFSGLLSKTDDPQKKQRFVELIESNNTLLLQLISDVLDLAKVESNTLEFYYQTVDLNELMSKIEQSIRFKVKENVDLRCVLGVEQCILETEPNRLSQLINNLLTNSCKFTTQGFIEFGYEIQGKSIYFFVKDTGIGISFENQQKLFQRFSKLNNFAQGTGLGLSICKGIVEKMGGCIGVVSAGEGKGSKFWFTIPFTPAVNSVKTTPQKETGTTAMQENQETTILIAEDNESNFMLFQSILESEYKLIHAWDGVQAIDLFKEHRPQVILMDIGMPNMDGYDATREIRKISKTVPIIAVTAYAFAADKSRILSNGFDSYISKPINAANLLKEIEAALGKKQSRNTEKSN